MVSTGGAYELSGTIGQADAGHLCVATTDGNGVQCQTLLAGQTIDAGTVCIEVVEHNLVVTYNTANGWELTETHIWAGMSLGDMPQTCKGNPKIGLFPYPSGDITGATSYSETIPLVDLGADCNQTWYVAAHAALRKDDGNGGYQTETGWADGDRIVDKGSWGTIFQFDLTCDCDTHPSSDCETAFALGDACFITDLYDCVDSTLPLSNCWGWQISGIQENTSGSATIYAGAGQCDTSKGTAVGTLNYNYMTAIDSTCSVTVSYNFVAPYTMTETHLFVSNNQICNVAPGQFGNLHEGINVSSDSYTISIPECGSINIVAHAVACGF